MGSLFRSQEMALCQLFLHTETAYMCISELGELGMVQFKDSTPDTSVFHRKFVNEVRRCDEMERKLRFLEKEICVDNIPIFDIGENPEAPAPRDIIDLESTFEKLEKELQEVNINAEQLKKNYLELLELKEILRKTQIFFDEGLHDNVMNEESLELLGEEGLKAGGLVGQGLRLGFVAGVILRERLPAFERMLWRACRGNVYLKQAEIDTELEDPISSVKVEKSVFLIFFHGDQLKTRVIKICEGFHGTIYPCPDSQTERREMAIGVMSRIEDLKTVLNQTQDHRHRVLMAAAKNLKNWFCKVRKIKAIYCILNMFNLDVTAKCMIGECWCAQEDLERIKLALRHGMERSNSSVQPVMNRIITNKKDEPPTYHKVNKFTTSFQDIVDSYGVAKYREVNPAPFTVITFPFLFAVMFGDAGHGLIMFIFALWMVLNEKKYQSKKSDEEIWNSIFGGRYIILLMGIFSIYTGLIYNDVFSKSLNIFGSSWYPGGFDNVTIHENSVLQLSPNNSIVYFGSPYPFGIDPVWQTSKNKITFTNSVKMKISIIFGVCHMLFGVVLSLFNHRFYQDKLSIYCEFLPQLIFLLSIFGYLIIQIFYKWIAFHPKDSYCAPSLLIGLINMFMFHYESPLTPDGQCNPTGTYYSGQTAIQSIIVVIAISCVPWMLIAKPIILRRNNFSKKTAENLNGKINDFSGVERIDLGTGDTVSMIPETEVEEFDFGEILVHQSIHTIEYCLGCISNTASYLRLWALSLAHGQLSEVLWGMILKIGLSSESYGGSIVLFLVFAIWASLTIFILLVMEGLSAFLHALRLHWVEFQNKFYAGNGYKFIPFSFESLMDFKVDES